MTGNEFRSLRAILGMKQADLARELDVSRTTLISWERRGEDGVPRLAELAILALRNIPGVRKWASDGIDISKVIP